jgi:hypothetical protein
MATRRSSDLEARLTDWGLVYGGGRYGLDEGIKSPLGSMMKWGGRPPSGLGQEPATPEADEVHAAVRALHRQSEGRMPAAILQEEYFYPGQPVDAKMRRIARDTRNEVSRAQYYQLLRLAKVYVAGRLRISFSCEEDAETS